jgi:hypothetical protein
MRQREKLQAAPDFIHSGVAFLMGGPSKTQYVRFYLHMLFPFASPCPAAPLH